MSATAFGALLAAACGFGATVWLLTAHFNRNVNIWHSILYTAVGVCYAAIGVLLTARILGHPLTPTPFITTILLSVVFVVPAAIQLAAHLAARRMIDGQRVNGHE